MNGYLLLCDTCIHILLFFRLKSGEMLRGKQNGTFLCRPTSKQSKLRNGELHTHTVDVV